MADEINYGWAVSGKEAPPVSISGDDVEREARWLREVGCSFAASLMEAMWERLATSCASKLGERLEMPEPEHPVPDSPVEGVIRRAETQIREALIGVDKYLRKWEEHVSGVAVLPSHNMQVDVYTSGGDQAQQIADRIKRTSDALNDLILDAVSSGLCVNIKTEQCRGIASDCTVVLVSVMVPL